MEREEVDQELAAAQELPASTSGLTWRTPRSTGRRVWSWWGSTGPATSS
jgi:hypothetical protein